MPAHGAAAETLRLASKKMRAGVYGRCTPAHWRHRCALWYSSLMTGSLIAAVIALQAERGWTDAQLAACLRIERSSWRLLRVGRRQPGVRALRGIARTFPQLQPAVIAAVLGTPTDGAA